MDTNQALKIVKGLLKRFSGAEPESLDSLGSNETCLTESKSDWANDGYSWVPDWKSILGKDWEIWLKKVDEAKNGPRILIATGVGGNSLLTPLETLYAIALTLRGAEVHFFLCDKSLPACQNSTCTDTKSQIDFLKSGPDKCDWCFETGKKALSQLGLPVHFISNYSCAQDVQDSIEITRDLRIEDLASLKVDGIPLEESVRSAALRYFGRGDFEEEKYATEVVKRYTQAAIISVKSLNRLWSQFQFKHMVVNQGCYVPQGISIEVAKKHKSRISCWDLSYMKNCVTFSKDDTYLKTIFSEPVSDWESITLSEQNEKEIDEYLKSRWTAEYDWMRLSTEESTSIKSNLLDDLKLLGFNPDKPAIGLLTNVIWDAQLIYKDNAFSGMLDWLLKSVDYFSRRPELQLLIRIHPAEKKCWLNSRQLALDEIGKVFPSLSSNIIIIPAESPINTYEAMNFCDSAIIYATTAGLELSCMGIPVIVAGEGWIRNKGFSFDISTEEDYFKLLDTLPFSKPLSAHQKKKAKAYAFHFFFRKSIPLNMLSPLPYENQCYEIKPTPLSGFDSNADPGLDIICDGILKNGTFIYPYEEIETKF